MKILITNIWLDKFCGTESWCYAIANELKRRGHIVDIYTRAPGVFMKEFEKSGFKKIEGLDGYMVLTLNKPEDNGEATV